ncbi:sporulation initiation factor Spo0A C-terminal domain-containing protein [uncultured Intestinimonas sp.]|uniref:sporulation initiation factor Spo0A C-terminal domain-containing protein n=1 Tax=uncultured Intestinimonas sp. TaxID=1689265 RepID=UPI00294277F6|nr:sporulation initiation factor Spo0A C-terminal domain-containing protein [uncultured Intestinimonas sp.]
MDYPSILFQLGITPNYAGFHQMLTALEIVEANPETLTLVTKWLYPAVAKRHQTNWKQVERNLRIIVGVA